MIGELRGLVEGDRFLQISIKLSSVCFPFTFGDISSSHNVS